MAFQPKAQYMTPFTKKQGSGEFKPTPTDTLFEVVSYDVDTATIVAKRVSDGKTCNVSVSYDSVARNRKFEKSTTTASWFGHLIDERMSKVIEVGNKFVAERAVWVRNQKGGNPLYECTRIINLTDQSENKIINGLLTVSGWDGRIRSVQVWSRDSFSVSDTDAIGMTSTGLDTIAAQKASGLFPVEHGFQFRVVRDGKVVELSTCYDFFPAVKDEAGNEVSPRRTPTGAEFKQLLEEFTEYANEKYSGTSASVEFTTYNNLNASKMSKSMEVSERSAGFQMITATTRIDAESDIIQQGKNLAIVGIASLTSDAVDKKSRTFVQRDMVNKVFLNGVRGNVHSFIRSPGGVKVALDDSLKIFKPKAEKAEPVAQVQGDPTYPFEPQKPLANNGESLELLFDDELDWDNV